VDLYEPGSGSQVHDFNGGILASGLFWTLPPGEGDVVDLGPDARRARLELHDVPVIESFTIAGQTSTPARVSLSVEWKATGRRRHVGRGDAVDPTDPAAFLGSIAAAFSIGSFEVAEFGFSASSEPGASSERGYGLLGTERNGSAL
jgi:hypothetical protein